MNTTYRINATFAVSKAKEAVKGWELGVAKAKSMNAAPDMIKFAEDSLASCVANLEKTRRDVKENWTAYL